MLLDLAEGMPPKALLEFQWIRSISRRRCVIEWRTMARIEAEADLDDVRGSSSFDPVGRKGRIRQQETREHAKRDAVDGDG